MGVHVQWDNCEKTVIRWDFDGRWDWVELHSCEAQANQMCQSVGCTVDFILNMESTSWMPRDAFTHLKAFSRRRAANIGIITLAGSGLFIEMLVKDVQQIQSGHG